MHLWNLPSSTIHTFLQVARVRTFILSPNSSRSMMVKGEMEYAIHKRHLRLVPTSGLGLEETGISVTKTL